MRQRVWLFPIFLGSLLVACSGGDSDKSNVHVQRQPAAFNQKMTAPVELRTQASLSPNGLIMVSGETNLPNQTELLVSASNETAGFSATGKTVVHNGKFSAKPLGPESGLLPGDYIISTVMPVSTVQPESVQLITGKKGEFLTGPLVKVSSWGSGNYVEYSFLYVIGSKQTITNLQKENRKNVAEVRSSLDRLLKNGRAMEQYRHSNDLPAIAKCREMMIENGKQAELIQAKANELKTKTIHKEFIALGAASIEMRMCVTCSDNALESCDSAADYLQNGLSNL